MTRLGKLTDACQPEQSSYGAAMSSSDSRDAGARMRIALDLFELGENMLRQRLRRDRPSASAAEIEEAVRVWRTTRPGAESGDAPGRLRPWPGE